MFLFIKRSFINGSIHGTASQFSYEGIASSRSLLVTSIITAVLCEAHLSASFPMSSLVQAILVFLVVCFPPCWPVTSLDKWLQRARLMANLLHPSLLSFFDTSILFLRCLNLCIAHLKWSHFSVIILKRKYVMLLFSLKFPVMGCHASCSPHVANLMYLLCLFMTRGALQCLLKHSCVLRQKTWNWFVSSVMEM